MACDMVAIQADYDAAILARRAAMNGSYTLDTGQGRQQVTRPDLSQMNALIKQLESDLNSCKEEGDGYGSIGDLGFRRNG
jgi:hypothetical protein